MLTLSCAFALGRFMPQTPGRALARPDAAHEPRVERVEAAAAVQPANVVERVRQTADPARAAPEVPCAGASNEAELRTRLRQLDASVSSEGSADERSRLLEQWATKNPQAAMAYAEEFLKSDRRAQAISTILTKWAERDASGAWTWARSRGSSEAHHAHTVMEEVAQHDAARATGLLREFMRDDPNEAVAMSLTAMRGIAYHGDFEAASSLASSVELPNAEDRGVLMNYMAGQWARHNPERAADWVQSLHGLAREQALVGLGESWAEVDAAGAADFAIQLGEGPLRQSMLRQALASWLASDPDAAGSWLRQFEQVTDVDQALAEVATMRNAALR